MCNSKSARRRRKALKFASASEFGNFASRGKPPASIFHEISKISNFAPDLDPHKSFAKNFSGTPRPNHNHQHISLNKLTGGYRKWLSGFWADNENVTEMPEISVHQIFASRPRSRGDLLAGNHNTVSTSHVQLEITKAAPQNIEIRISERIWWFFVTWEATSINISWKFRKFEFHHRPWGAQIFCQEFFWDTAT